MSPWRPSSVARPKSSSTTRPPGVTRTFDGLMSRCNCPRRAGRDPASELQERVPEAPPPGRRERRWRPGPARRVATRPSEAWPTSASVVVKPVLRQPSPAMLGSSRTYRRKSAPSTSSMTMYQPRPLKISSYRPHEVDVDDVEEAAKLILEPENRLRVLVPDRLRARPPRRDSCRAPVDDSHPAAAEQAQDLVAGHLGPVFSGVFRGGHARASSPARSSAPSAGAGPARNARWTSNWSATSRARPGNRRRYSSARGDSPSSSRSAISSKISARTASGSSRSADAAPGSPRPVSRRDPATVDTVRPAGRRSPRRRHPTLLG